MNAYQAVQQSPIQWPNVVPPPLYEPPRELMRWPSRQQHAVFEHLEGQMGEFAAQHEAALIDVRRHYVLPADSSVTDFLSEHRTIPQLLLESVEYLKECFGPNTLFTLRAPIDESGSRTLYAVITWPGSITNVRNGLDRFDNDWWLAHSRQASGYLSFTYELV